MEATETRAVGFTDKLKTALALCDSVNSIVVKTDDDYRAAEDKRKLSRELKDQLLKEYAEHPIIIKAMEMRDLKVSTEKRLDAFNRDVKQGPMLAYENKQEEIRQEKERKLAEQARKEQEAETARQIAAQKAVFDAVEKIRKVAEAAAAKTKDADRRKQLEEDAARAAAAAEAARAEAAAIKQDAAQAPLPVVVVEKTAPQVARTAVQKWRLTLKDGRKVTPEDFKKVLRIRPEEVPGMPQGCFVLDHVAVSGIVKSLGKNHNIPGLETWTEYV